MKAIGDRGSAIGKISGLTSIVLPLRSFDIGHGLFTLRAR